MFSVSEEQYEFMLADIEARGVILEDLQDSLLDHMCCIIENELTEPDNFYGFYEQLLPRFFKQELKEIQEETDKLLTFKNYYAMKNTLKISGITATLLALLGAVLKVFHLPGAGITIVLGAVIFSLIFLPLMIALKFKDEESQVDKWVFSFGFLIGSAATLGFLFKVMHWPYANILMVSSISTFVFIYVPLYYITRIRRPDLKFNTTVNAVLMMGCGSMLFAMINLNSSVNIQESVAASYGFMLNHKNALNKANEKLALTLEDAPTVNQFRSKTKALQEKLDAISWNLIAKTEQISINRAKKLRFIDMQHPNDAKIVRNSFEIGNDALSMTQLEKDIALYNEHVSLLFPGQQEKQIVVDDLKLDQTILSVLLHELLEIQVQIASTENCYLNSVKTKS